MMIPVVPLFRRSRGPHHNGHYMKKDDGFTQRMVVVLCTATADKNYTDVKASVRALAKEHGYADCARKIVGS
jgi:hypothetical protein